MKALVWKAPEQMSFEVIPDPVPARDEVIIRVEAVGICGSEIEGYLGHNSLRIPPLVMGHEFSGVIEQIGDAARQLAVGQKVTVNPLLFCGSCKACLRGRMQLCKERKIIGIHRPGAFAERVAVPVQCVVPVDEQLSFTRAALAEPLACALRATRKAMERHPFANVCVIGAGGIGILCAKIAKILGASRILIADTNAKRLEVVTKIGAADWTVNPLEENIQDVLADKLPDQGIDVVIDAAGFQATRSMAFEIIDVGGTIMNVGLGIDETRIEVNRAIRNEIDVLGSFCYTRKDFMDAVQLLQDGKVTEEGWTEIRSHSQGVESFAQLVAGQVTSGKIILHPERG